MSYSNQTNSTDGPQNWGTLEKVLFSIVVTLPCCVFLFINGTMLITLRSKALFRETSRYVLVFNLLFADTVQLAQSQCMYILSFSGVTLTYPLCGALIMLLSLTSKISPLTLAVMSMERYVAVCYPLRHANIITIQNTGLAILGVWTLSSFSVFIQVLLMLMFPFEELETLQMEQICTSHLIVLLPVSDHYKKGSTCFIFVTAGISVICSYVGVMVAARSASTDKASAHKARNTLLLHLVQLGLSLCSTIHTPLLFSLLKIMTRIIFLRVQAIFYIGFIILPRCLSALIYGLRDQEIRPVFMYHLRCQGYSPLLSAAPEKCKISLIVT